MSRESIRARAEAATPGAWYWEGDNFDDQPESCPHGTDWTDHGPFLISPVLVPSEYGGKPYPKGVLTSGGHDASFVSIESADAAFIAHARQDIPALLAVLEAAAEVEKAEQAYLDAQNRAGHPGEDHDDDLARFGKPDPRAYGDCSRCAGAEYGTYDWFRSCLTALRAAIEAVEALP